MFVITIFAVLINGITMLVNVFDTEDFEIAFWQLLAEAYLVLAAIALGHAPFPK
jgi:uncharacterized membrane protein HdeD (DUF308 family)